MNVMPGMPDPRFARSVVLLCSHGPEGAMGLILNRVMDGVDFGALLGQLNIAMTIGAPLAVIPNQISVLREDGALADMFSQAILNMRLRGIEDKILDAFERNYPNAFYRAEKLYVIPESE